MSYYRIKPVRKRFKKTGTKTYYYVYEVESYKRRFGKKVKVRQRTRRFIGPYTILKKVKDNSLSFVELVNMEKDEIIMRIISSNIENYGFRQTKPNVFVNGDLCVDLNQKRVFEKSSNANVYININDAYFGTETLWKLLNFKFKTKEDLMDFVKVVTYSGLLNLTETSEKIKKPKAGGTDLQELMDIMESLIEKGKPGKKDPMLENNAAILKVLLSKFPGYKDMQKEVEQTEEMKAMSVEEFQKNIGW